MLFFFGGNHIAKYRDCGKWKEAKAGTCGACGEERSTLWRCSVGDRSPQPSPEQMSLGDVWNDVLRGDRVVKAQTATPPQHSTQVAETPKKAPVTSTSKKATSKNPAPKVSAAPKMAPTKKASTKQCVAKPTAYKQLVPTPTVNPYPLEGIPDLLDTLRMDTCVDLTRRIFAAVPSLTSGPARSREVQKAVVLLVPEYGITA
jgi:hypothetical protein